MRGSVRIIVTAVEVLQSQSVGVFIGVCNGYIMGGLEETAW